MRYLLVLLLAIFTVPAATANDGLPLHLQMDADFENLDDDVHDPMEGWNRGIYKFNEVLDNLILEPVARGYKFVTPDPVESGVRHAIRNLGEPVNMLNALLQGDVQQAFTSFWRFVLNSTFGMAGTWDFAGTYGNLPYREEDFGQTLAVWGVSSGPYLMLPLLGPSNLRDGPSRLVDAASNPWNYILNDEALIIEKSLTVVSGRADRLQLTDDLDANSLDPYAAIRSGYMQRRHSRIKNR